MFLLTCQLLSSSPGNNGGRSPPDAIYQGYDHVLPACICQNTIKTKTTASNCLVCLFQTTTILSGHKDASYYRQIFSVIVSSSHNIKHLKNYKDCTSLKLYVNLKRSDMEPLLLVSTFPNPGSSKWLCELHWTAYIWQEVTFQLHDRKGSS